jgi:hypothetical protein
MENHGMDQATSNNSRWLWLGASACLAIFALSNGKLLLASGFLLLGVFAIFNNPMAPTPAQVAKPRTLVWVSWACGALGILAVLAAAASTWL